MRSYPGLPAAYPLPYETEKVFTCLSSDRERERETGERQYISLLFFGLQKGISKY